MRLIAWISSRFSHYSCCFKCGLDWRFVEWHDTMYSEYNGCIPLCESCWSKLTPEQRLPYYEKLVFSTWKQPEKWYAIKKAVLEGK